MIVDIILASLAFHSGVLAIVPVNSGGIRLSSSVPPGWGVNSQGGSVCGISYVGDQLFQVIEGFNTQFCNGAWSGSIATHSAAYSEGGTNLMLTSLPTMPTNWNVGAGRRPIDCGHVEIAASGLSAEPGGNTNGCGAAISFSCDLNTDDSYAGSPWQYSLSFFTESDRWWFIGPRHDKEPLDDDRGSGSGGINFYPSGQGIIECGFGIRCSNNPLNFQSV